MLELAEVYALLLILKFYIIAGLLLFLSYKSYRKEKKNRKQRRNYKLAIILLICSLVSLSIGLIQKNLSEHSNTEFSKKNVHLVDFDLYLPGYTAKGVRLNNISLPSYDFQQKAELIINYEDSYGIGYSIDEKNVKDARDYCEFFKDKQRGCNPYATLKNGTTFKSLITNQNTEDFIVTGTIGNCFIQLTSNAKISKEEILKILESMKKTPIRNIDFHHKSEFSI